ncbi:MAG: cytochrome P450 [Verrucomicrobiales bacterium]|nr:cytochrome P450 [Verrucomicrobiales bacterium]
MERKSQLPPGPSGSWRPTLELIRNPRAAMEKWVGRYGDPFLLHSLNGPVVVTAREELIRQVHGADPALFVPFAVQTMLPLMGPGSLFVLDGEEHRRERRLITPMFHGDRMRQYGSEMQRTAVDCLESRRPRGTVVTLDLMTDISLETIVRTIFGGEDRDQVNQLMDASKQIVARSHPLIFFSRKTHVSVFGWSPWDRFVAAREGLFRLLDRIIDQRAKSSASREDILSMLCGARYEDGSPISRPHIHSELMTFLFAGHETTALTLTWAIYHLHRSPEILARLRSELDALPEESPASLTAAPYLKAVVQETLRIHPIVTETLRKLAKPMSLGGYDLPAGMAIAPATVLVHHNPKLYPDPERFRPERFLERTYSPTEYLPFGGGHRRCIGAAFASYEMTMVLGTLLRRYVFELVDSEPVVPKRKNVTIGPSTGVPVRVLGVR